MNEVKSALSWVLGFVMTILLSMSTFFLKSLHGEIKTMSQNVHSIVVQQSIIDTRLSAVERSMALYDDRFKGIDERQDANERWIREFFQTYDLKKK